MKRETGGWGKENMPHGIRRKTQTIIREGEGSLLSKKNRKKLDGYLMILAIKDMFMEV